MEFFHAFLFVSIWKSVESVFTFSFLDTINVVIEMIASDSSGQFHVFLHDGGSLGMDGTEIGIFKDSNKVCF
jgi:hypothetical protein